MLKEPFSSEEHFAAVLGGCFSLSNQCLCCCAVLLVGLDDCEDECERKCDLQEEFDPYEAAPPLPPQETLFPKQNERPEIVHNPLLLGRSTGANFTVKNHHIAKSGYIFEKGPTFRKKKKKKPTINELFCINIEMFSKSRNVL